MSQLEKGMNEDMGPAQDAVVVIQHHGLSPELGTRSRREPEDTQAPPSGGLQSETRGTALSPGSPESGGRSAQEVPWLRVGIGSVSGQDFKRL